jgi:hypothetical protein
MRCDDDREWRGNICDGVLPTPLKVRYVRNDILHTGTKPGEWEADFPETTKAGEY